MKILILTFSVLLFLGAGCMHTNSKVISQGNTGEPMPAHIVELSADDKKNLQTAASSLLFGRKISLSNTVFSQQNTVMIERSTKQNEQGKVIGGRLLETKAIVLSLWLESGVCYLQRNDTKDKAELTGMACQVL